MSPSLLQFNISIARKLWQWYLQFCHSFSWLLWYYWAYSIAGCSKREIMLLLNSVLINLADEHLSYHEIQPQFLNSRNMSTPLCKGCQSRTHSVSTNSTRNTQLTWPEQSLWAGETVGGPRGTWWCNDCYLLGRPRAAAYQLSLPDFSDRGSSSPWNALSSQARRRDQPLSQSHPPSIASSPPIPTPRGTPMQRSDSFVRVCRVCQRSEFYLFIINLPNHAVQVGSFLTLLKQRSHKQTSAKSARPTSTSRYASHVDVLYAKTNISSRSKHITRSG